MPARVFTAPARYRKFLESSLALAIAEIERDDRRRGAGVPPTINDQFLNREGGRLAVVVGAADELVKRRGHGRPRRTAPKDMPS